MTAKNDDFVYEKCHYTNKKGLNKITKYINKKANSKDILFFCIGTDRCIGDSFAPLLGTMLQKEGYEVIGTLKDPVHATNIHEKIKSIPEGKFIVAIDASLGKQKNIETISITNGSLKAGAGVNKTLPEVGNVSIKGAIGVMTDNSSLNYIVLQNTNLGLIWSMAESLNETIKKNISFNIDKQKINNITTLNIEIA